MQQILVKPQRTANKRRAIVLATLEGKIQFADATARRWLKQFFGRSDSAGSLPRKICRWLEGYHGGTVVSSIVAQDLQARLFLRKEKISTDQSTLLLLELIDGKAEEGWRRHRALTRREREVHHWLTCGKSNPEIAAILGMARATVGKHIERIYPKLGSKTAPWLRISNGKMDNARKVFATLLRARRSLDLGVSLALPVPGCSL